VGDLEAASGGGRGGKSGIGQSGSDSSPGHGPDSSESPDSSDDHVPNDRSRSGQLSGPAPSDRKDTSLKLKEARGAMRDLSPFAMRFNSKIELHRAA